MHRFDTLTWPAVSRIGILDERRLLVSPHEQATRASAFILVSSQLRAACTAPAPPARAQDDGLAPPVAATAGPAMVLAAPRVADERTPLARFADPTMDGTPVTVLPYLDDPDEPFAGGTPVMPDQMDPDADDEPFGP